jgi:shikimate 5-dehydrogenase
MHGTGKSTLAVIASIACRRRVVDVDDLFQEATGFSTAKYRKEFGASNHNLRQEELLRTTLQKHDKGAIIVCNGGSLGRNGQILLQEFSRTHPVVHIMRDLRSVHDYLGGVDLKRLKDMLAFTAPMMRSCSNYEFFNISETNVAGSSTLDDQPVAPAFITLKRAQRTFLKFLSLVASNESCGGPIGSSIPPLEPGYPLSDVPTELRKYTCAVQVHLEDLLAEDVDIQRLEIGSDAFEVIVDPDQLHQMPDFVDSISSCISKVRRSTVVPLIYHVYPASSTGRNPARYLELVRHGLRLAPEYATVDLSLSQDTLTELITTRGTSKIIGHLHGDQPWDDASWITHFEKAARLGCAFVRFSRPAGLIDDDVSVPTFRAKISAIGTPLPVACYNTGRAGRRTVCFNRHLTPVIPVSHLNEPDFSARMAQYPQGPWLTARDVTRALYTSFTLDAMQMYIIGAKLGYSVSPAMHNAAYDACGMPHQFNRMQSSSGLNSLKDLVHKSNFGGSIVIQPYKVEVMSLADSLSQHARAIGAVNTLIPVRHLKEDGGIPTEFELFQERNQSGPIQALYGDNTEWIGIRSCIRRGLSPANAVRPTSCGLVIGAGAMARAAVYALMQLGVRNIVIWNRTYQKAEQLVAHFRRLQSSSMGKTAVSSITRQDSQPNFFLLQSRDDAWPENFRQPTIILSCIPADPIDDSPAAMFTLPPQWMESASGGVVMEIAYKTLNTPLMQQVRDSASKLWTYMDGLDFIPEQAFAQFELFTGKRAPRRVMREEVLRAWRDEQGNADPDMVERRLKVIDDQEP